MRKPIQHMAKDVFEYVQGLWYRVFYVALYGSQNYGIDTPSSDFDWKAIIVPSLDELISQSKPTSKVLEYQGGQIEVKDIRNYIESAVKVNVNFIELLNTEYYYSTDMRNALALRSYFKPLLDEQGEIYLRACHWMMMQKFHALRHPYPSKLKVLDKYWYDPKQLCHIVRLKLLMERYIEWNYSFVHTWVENKILRDLKTFQHSQEYVDTVVNNQLLEAQSIIDNYKQKPTFNAKYSLIEFSRDVIYQYIYAFISNDFNSTYSKRRWKSYSESNQLEDSTSETTSEP